MDNNDWERERIETSPLMHVANLVMAIVIIAGFVTVCVSLYLSYFFTRGML